MFLLVFDFLLRRWWIQHLCKFFRLIRSDGAGAVNGILSFLMLDLRCGDGRGAFFALRWSGKKGKVYRQKIAANIARISGNIRPIWPPEKLSGEYPARKLPTEYPRKNPRPNIQGISPKNTYPISAPRRPRPRRSMPRRHRRHRQARRPR